MSWWKRVALKVLAMGVDRDRPVYIVLKGDDMAEVQVSGEANKTIYKFFKRSYR